MALHHALSGFECAIYRLVFRGRGIKVGNRTCSFTICLLCYRISFFTSLPFIVDFPGIQVRSALMMLPLAEFLEVFRSESDDRLVYLVQKVANRSCARSNSKVKKRWSR